MTSTRKLGGVHAGSAEPIFGHLPQRILHDLGRRGSESSLLWNRIYARATPRVSIGALLALPQLWGPRLPALDDSLEPYYWGFNLEGRRLAKLDESLAELDGPGRATEVDLYLLGSTELVLVEAKANAEPGRCGRYAAGRCPEIHTGLAADAATPDPGAPLEASFAEGDRRAAPLGRGSAEGLRAARLDPKVEVCRYWELEQARFSRWLDFGSRPDAGAAAPPCDRHYQLGRTLLLGQRLAERLNRTLHLWLLLPKRRWPAIQPTWLDFADRVKPAETWRRMRVVSWEVLAALPISTGRTRPAA